MNKEVLVDEYMVDILNILNVPRSCPEMDDILSMGIATIYRKVKELREHGLIEVYDSNATDGKRRKFYIRTTDSVTIDFDGRIDKIDQGPLQKYKDA